MIESFRSNPSLDLDPFYPEKLLEGQFFIALRSSTLFIYKKKCLPCEGTGSIAALSSTVCTANADGEGLIEAETKKLILHRQKEKIKQGHSNIDIQTYTFKQRHSNRDIQT